MIIFFRFCFVVGLVKFLGYNDIYFVIDLISCVWVFILIRMCVVLFFFSWLRWVWIEFSRLEGVVNFWYRYKKILVKFWFVFVILGVISLLIRLLKFIFVILVGLFKKFLLLCCSIGMLFEYWYDFLLDLDIFKNDLVLLFSWMFGWWSMVDIVVCGLFLGMVKFKFELLCWVIEE